MPHHDQPHWWGRMVSCAPVGNRRWSAIGKRRQAGYQPAAGCQPAPQADTFGSLYSWWSARMTEANNLAGKVVLVTGAAKRIGRGIALRLAAEGARVAIHYSRSEKEAR